jgi:hypothetical protein
MVSPQADPIGAEIYLDRSQCERFGVEYTGDRPLVCSAEAILKSKEYDQEHRDVLEPLGASTVVAEPLGHGWFRVVRVICGGR